MRATTASCKVRSRLWFLMHQRFNTGPPGAATEDCESSVQSSHRKNTALPWQMAVPYANRLMGHCSKCTRTGGTGSSITSGFRRDRGVRSALERLDANRVFGKNLIKHMLGETNN